MSQEIKLYVRTADQTRRAELDLDPGSTGADIIQAAVNTTTGRALAPGESLSKVARPGDVLEVQPVLVAG
jgi:hypothetical protein